MAIFQNNEHHADETVRRTFTPADRNFLLNLQAELNTQSNMGNADPVFWVLKGTQSVVTGNSTDIEMEVTDGATEQTDEVETLCGALAREFPCADISYSEVNEELYTPDRFMTWKNGQKVKDAFGRKLDPNCLDPETIRTCIDVISGIQVHTLPEAKQALQKLLEQSA